MSSTIDYGGWDYTPTDNSHLIGRPLVITETLEGWIEGPREEMLEQGVWLQTLLPGIEVHWTYSSETQPL